MNVYDYDYRYLKTRNVTTCVSESMNVDELYEKSLKACDKYLKECDKYHVTIDFSSSPYKEGGSNMPLTTLEEEEVKE